MAVLGTNTSTFGSPDFTVYVSVAYPTSTAALPSMGFFPPFPSRATRFRQRVWDNTNLNWCYYESITINPTPGPTDTSPVNSGSISHHAVLAIDNQLEL
jgi:hypothetical protein